MNNKISIIGAGAWGTTLAMLLTENNYEVKIWTYEKEVAEQINSFKENKTYLNGFPLSSKIEAFNSMEDCLTGAAIVFIVVPSEHFRKTLKQAAKYLKDQTLVIATKGIEIGTGKRMSEIAQEETELKNIVVISGPNLSKEIAKGKPAAAVAASPSKICAEKIQNILMQERFRVYTSDDVAGIEISGALKNIIAISAGVCDALNLGDNAKASLLVRGLAEIARLGKKIGAKAETFNGLSGMGDLIATCASPLSRNHQVGFRIGKGEKLDEIKKDMKSIAEGVPTCKAVYSLAKKLKVEMPITEETFRVLFEGKAPYQAISELMQRKPKKEVE